MINIKLLDEVLQKIDECPSNWNQDDWAIAREGDFTNRKKAGEPDKLELTESCGTAFCVAGWVAVINKQDILWEPILDYDNDDEGDVTGYRAYRLTDGQSIFGYAMDALGLSSEEANLLFEGTNGREKLTYIRNRLVITAKNRLLQEKNNAVLAMLKAAQHLGEIQLQEDYLNSL